MLGYNYWMSNLMAAIGQVQLKKIDQMTEKRHKNARYFSAHLDTDVFVCPKIRLGCEHIFHQYVIRRGDGCNFSRDELREHLRENGIGSAVHYPIPVYKQPVYQKHSSDIPSPVTERLCTEVFSLPIHPGVGEDECRIICDILNGVQKHEKIRTVHIEEEDRSITGDFMRQEIHVYWKSENYTVEDERYVQENIIEKILVPKTEPLKAELMCFLDCIKTGTPFRITLKEATRNLEVCEQLIT